MTTTEKLAAALSGCVDELELHEKQATSDGDVDLLARLEAAREALAEYEATARRPACDCGPVRHWECNAGCKARAAAPTAEHAPGPWRTERQTRRDGWTEVLIVGADFPGMGIVATVNMARVAVLRGEPDGEANARRIVACVNACAGVPVEALERDSVRAIIRNVYEGSTTHE